MAHLTSEQRYTISVMLEKKISQSEIAATIGRRKTVVSREIRRNSDRRNGQYRVTGLHWLAKLEGLECEPLKELLKTAIADNGM